MGDAEIYEQVLTAVEYVIQEWPMVWYGILEFNVPLDTENGQSIKI